ncbi:MAG: flagellar motor stator protein MotA [Alphaproteobacteria bacterium]|nr:flagellar motor stator protein MotA [Alphaproteobacteria bacterium]
MISLGGIVLLFATVFGGYLASGGYLEPILEALTFEGVMIGGAAISAAIVANSLSTLVATAKAMGAIIKGPKWKTKDYQDLLCLMFVVNKTIKTKGMMALETHIEKPHESALFGRFPKIQHDHFVMSFICDTLRMVSMNLEDPHQVLDHMEKQLDKHHGDALKPSQVMQFVSESLPALGIVAAVLGVIKTMGSILEPPEVLGAMIGGALTGTFLGVFLAYGIADPIASRIKGIVNEEATFYKVVMDIMIAHLHGNAAQISIEIGRGSVPHSAQPTFQELDETISNLPADMAA